MEGERDDAVGLALDEEERIIQRGDAHTVGLSVQPADPMLRGCGTRRPPDVHMGKRAYAPPHHVLPHLRLHSLPHPVLASRAIYALAVLSLLLPRQTPKCW